MKKLKKIMLVVGARPNFIKAAPLMKELQKQGDMFQTYLVHTGQHYDHNLSRLFFDELQMAEPDKYLGVGSGTHAQQTAKIMTELEDVLIDNKVDLVIVFGDVNSTMAAAIVAAKLGIKLAHVEAGLRSFDKNMPEEINRIVTDRLSDYLFTTEKAAEINLRNEGIPEDNIFFTGNIMIDSLVNNLRKARRSRILEKLSIEANKYAAMTLHRPSNVDDKITLTELLEAISEISKKIKVIFPCHPRTRKKIQRFSLLNKSDSGRFHVIEPLGYLDFLKLQSSARFILTDSGGIQEETTYLKIPCITIRDNTERPVTTEIGSNVLTGTNSRNIIRAAINILNGHNRKGKVPQLWDGKTASRIAHILVNRYLEY